MNAHLGIRDDLVKLLVFFLLATAFATQLIGGDSALATSMPHSSQQADTEYVQVERVEDVIAKWSEKRPLYVKGDVGVSKEQLKKLAGWIRENGSNWTVVLMQTAQGELFTAGDGHKYRNLDAVEYALREGLANRTDFGSLTHPETHEQFGAVFLMTVEERKLSYYSSPFQDRRGLGAARWSGYLDREAKRAMRNGGRVADAVRNTIKSINLRAEAQLKREASKLAEKRQLEEQRKLERDRAIESLKAEVEEISDNLVQRVVVGAEKIKDQFPAANESELANPPIEKWRSRLAVLIKQIDEPALKEANDLRRSPAFKTMGGEVNTIRREVNRFLDLFAAHSAFDQMVGPVESRLDAIADHPSGAAEQTSTEAYRLLDEARTGHERGLVDFANQIREADSLAEQGEQSIRLAQQRVLDQQKRNGLIRFVISIIVAILGAILLGVMWLLNVRRRPALRRAHAVFEKKQKAVANELENVHSLVNRTREVLGTTESFAEKGYEGETAKVGQATLNRTKGIESLASECERVVGYASELIHPAGPIAEAANMFSGARYEHCVNELHGPTVQMPAELSQNEAIKWISLEEAFIKLREQSVGVAKDLDRFESCFTRLNDGVDELQQKINEVSDLEKKLSRSARLDRLFQVPSLFDKLIPAAQSRCDRAELLAGKDPILAMDDELPSGLSLISSGLLVAQKLSEAREKFPQFEEAKRKLSTLGFKDEWVDESLQRLSDEANHALDLAIDGKGDLAAGFEHQFTEFEQKVRRSVEVGDQLKGILQSDLDSLEKRIASERETIGRKLQLDSNEVLREPGYDPDVDLKQARSHLDAACAAIDFGGVELALESIEISKVESKQAKSLIEDTLASLESFAQDRIRFEERTDSYRGQVEQLNKTVEKLTACFSPAAFTLQHDAFDESGGTQTVSQLFTLSKNWLEESTKGLKQADGDHSEGKILTAANALDLVQEDLDGVERSLELLTSHCSNIELQHERNGPLLKSCESQLEAVHAKMEDLRTEKPTLHSYGMLRDSIREFAVDFRAARDLRDPFADEIKISGLSQQVEELNGCIQSDWNSYDQAALAVAGAEKELLVAERLVAESASDRIPDSQGIRTAKEQCRILESDIEKLRKQLDVPHNNWQMVDAQAVAIHGRLGVESGRLRKELDLAKQAVEVFSEASQKVYEAANWSGAYNIIVVGKPGSQELERARDMLARGNYVRCIEFSKAAKVAAFNAIEEAKRQVKRKRRQIARDAEARRRRQRSEMFVNANHRPQTGQPGITFGKVSNRSTTSGSQRRVRHHQRDNSSQGGSGFGRSGW